MRRLGDERISSTVLLIVMLPRFSLSACLATFFTLHLRVLVEVRAGLGLHFLFFQPGFERLAHETYAHAEHDNTKDNHVHELTCERSFRLLANSLAHSSRAYLGHHEVGEPASELGGVILLVGGPEQND